MPNVSNLKPVYRIIDANINRAKEGLRVCEDIARFMLDSRGLVSGFKKARHRITAILKCLPVDTGLYEHRESAGDVGRNIHINELRRDNWQDIFYANMQRIKESVRVMEEFVKLINRNTALKFKKLRYDIYGLEKDSAKKISSYLRSRK
ncbi:MAG: thiamine-phosphate pyrophosphorylase [Candidatus Omnitrophota bacterium]